MVYKLLTKAKGDYMKRKKEEKSCTQEACFMVEECTQIMQRQSFQLFRLLNTTARPGVREVTMFYLHNLI